jgi:hypothetical protein
MNIAGHWMSMQMVHTMFLIFGLEILVVAVLLYLFMRPGGTSEARRNAPDNTNRKKRRVRKKR